MPRATALLARGRKEEAQEVLLAPGVFPEITSRVCPAERFCEGACAREHDGLPVAVAGLERTLADDAVVFIQNGIAAVAAFQHTLADVVDKVVEMEALEVLRAADAADGQ